MAAYEQKIKELNNKIARLVERFTTGVPETVQNQGYAELRFIRDAYNNSFTYARTTGRQTALPSFGKRWRKIKEAMGWDMRRGWAKTSGLGQAVGNPGTMRRTDNGFYYDLVGVNSKIKNYWKTFRTSNSKTAQNSLMQFKKGVNSRMQIRLKKQIEILVREIFGDGAKVTGRAGNVTIQIAIEKGLRK